MRPSEALFVVDLLLGHFCAHAGAVLVREGRRAEDLRRVNCRRHPHAAVHLLQFAAYAGAGHYGWRTAANACATLERHHFYSVQPYAVRHNESISGHEIAAAKSRTVLHVRLFQFVGFASLLLVSARNEKSNA